MKIGIYPGSFDPVTFGHLDIIERGAKIVDKLIVGVLTNNAKTPLFSSEERVRMINNLTKHLDNVEAKAFDGLTVDFAQRHGAQFIVKGVRSVKDFEFEREQADINRRLTGVETVLLYAEPGMDSISSTVVRELTSYGRDCTEFLP